MMFRMCLNFRWSFFFNLFCLIWDQNHQVTFNPINSPCLYFKLSYISIQKKKKKKKNFLLPVAAWTFLSIVKLLRITQEDMIMNPSIDATHGISATAMPTEWCFQQQLGKLRTRVCALPKMMHWVKPSTCIACNNKSCDVHQFNQTGQWLFTAVTENKENTIHLVQDSKQIRIFKSLQKNKIKATLAVIKNLESGVTLFGFSFPFCRKARSQLLSLGQRTMLWQLCAGYTA